MMIKMIFYEKVIIQSANNQYKKQILYKAVITA